MLTESQLSGLLKDYLWHWLDNPPEVGAFVSPFEDAVQIRMGDLLVGKIYYPDTRSTEKLVNCLNSMFMSYFIWHGKKKVIWS